MEGGLNDFFIWSIYNVLFAVAYTLMLPKFLLRMRKRGGYRQNFMQRFGVYDDDILAALNGKNRIWIHAVSVGEIFVALHFMEELRRQLPQAEFILSTTTSTGYAQAKQKIADNDVLIYYPTDFPGIVKRVIRQLNPATLILTECELWPNLLRHLNRRDIPVFVVNARISESSFRGYSKIKPFFRRAAEWVALFAAQSQLDRQRLLALGVAPEKVKAEGSAKYDVATPDPDGLEFARRILQQAGMDPDAEILVAGSTWPGEEELLLDIFAELKAANPARRMILVPRHMERRAEVENILRQKGCNYIKRTDMEAGTPSPDQAPDILLADTTGELKHYYSIATVVFVGKSMGDNFGGQNPIEPAMFGKPVVVGPHMENFPGVMDDFTTADAILQVQDEAELRRTIVELFEDREKRTLYGRRAGELMAAKRGVVKRSVTKIVNLLPENIRADLAGEAA